MPNCQKCQSSFETTQIQKDFLTTVNLPLPKNCPKCRMQNRFAFRNERKLYHRKCDLTGRQIISIYNPESKYKVYEQHEWHSDKWDALDYGRDFDFNRPFFEQLNELMIDTPKLSVFATQNINSDYANGAQQDKDCYMIFVSDHNEDCYYSYAIDSCKDCLECLNCFKCELCIECIDCSGSYKLAHCERSHNCTESYFLSDCKNCSNCFGCFGLRGKKYHIFNQPHSKEEYEKKLASLNIGKRTNLEKAKKIFNQKKQQQQIHQYYDGNNNENSTGDHIVNCKNCIECYDSGDLEDCGHLIFSFKSKDCFDGHVVVDNCELCYETVSTISQYNTQFTFVSFFSKNSMYLDHCQHCNECFGCSGLKNKKHCIFNKQYSKEEYEKLKTKIIEHMKKTGEWGTPLPTKLSPFGYNETVAQEYFPLTKQQVITENLNWHDEDQNSSTYQGPNNEVPEDIEDASPEVTKQIFTCSTSQKPYKIIPHELKLYKFHQLPLPNQCFDERHLARLKTRNPRELFPRQCQKCHTTLESTYSPDRPETIYCEKCYLEATY